MNASISALGGQLRAARRRSGLSQAELALRVGRQRSRISELESELLAGRLGKDRLSSLVEICDALGLTLLIVPAHEAAVRQAASGDAPQGPAAESSFDDLFIDLGDEDD